MLAAFHTSHDSPVDYDRKLTLEDEKKIAVGGALLHELSAGGYSFELRPPRDDNRQVLIANQGLTGQLFNQVSAAVGSLELLQQRFFHNFSSREL